MPPAAADVVSFQPNVMVSTFAGSAAYGSADGTPDIATFSNPVSVIVEPTGSLLVSDYDDNTIRRVATDGSVTTLTKQRAFVQPFGLGYDVAGALYASTDYDPDGRKDMQSGTIWRVDSMTGEALAMASDMGRARSFAAVSDGRLVVSNYENNRLYLVTPNTGDVRELAGNGTPGCSGTFADGTGIAASFSGPYGMVVLSDGRIILADHNNHRLRAVTLDGVVSTFGGDGGDGSIDGALASARFSGPKALAVDAHDNLYLSDDGAHRIRRIGADGNVTTIAGDGTAGWKDGDGADAEFFGQEGLAITADGNTLFVADGTGGTDTTYNRVRKITLAP